MLCWSVLTRLVITQELTSSVSDIVEDILKMHDTTKVRGDAGRQISPHSGFKHQLQCCFPPTLVWLELRTQAKSYPVVLLFVAAASPDPGGLPDLECEQCAGQ